MYQDKDLVERVYNFDKPQYGIGKILKNGPAYILTAALTLTPAFPNSSYASESLEGEVDFLAPTEVYNPDMKGSVNEAIKEYFRKINPNKVKPNSDPVEGIKQDYAKAGKDLSDAVKNLFNPRLEIGQNISDFYKGLQSALLKTTLSPLLRPTMHTLGELGKQSENKGDVMASQIMNFFGNLGAYHASTTPLPTSYVADKSLSDSLILMGLINPNECYNEIDNKKTCNKVEAGLNLFGLGANSAGIAMLLRYIHKKTYHKPSKAAPTEITTPTELPSLPPGLPPP